jgi:hypothetical protein
MYDLLTNGFNFILLMCILMFHGILQNSLKNNLRSNFLLQKKEYIYIYILDLKKYIYIVCLKAIQWLVNWGCKVYNVVSMVIVPKIILWRFYTMFCRYVMKKIQNIEWNNIQIACKIFSQISLHKKLNMKYNQQQTWKFWICCLEWPKKPLESNLIMVKVFSTQGLRMCFV